MTTKKLHVNMFGGFSASYGNETLSIGKQRDSKFRQLFQILMTRPGQGFSKGEISRNLYGREEVEDANASLNNTIFRLRKYLGASSLPSGEYLHLEGGILRFDSEIEVQSDVWSFEVIVLDFEREQDSRKKADLCKKACELYQGEFLPGLSNEQWVIEKSRNYQKLYFRSLEYLLRWFKLQGDYQGMEIAARCAAKIYPNEGWESWRMEALLALGRRKEAEEVYRKTAESLQESGGFLSKKQQVRFQELGTRMWQPEGGEEEIRKCLAELDRIRGAYSCSLPSFLDCFRILNRVIVRGGNGFSLILCTILDSRGCPATDHTYCEKWGRELCVSFHTHLRRGDVYTKYSKNQYLLLCIGAEREHAVEIEARIDMDFRSRYRGKGGLRCQILECRGRELE